MWLVVAFYVTTAAAQTPRSADRLINAVTQGDAAAVVGLLNGKPAVDVQAPEADGTTALHWAVYKDNVPIATLLIRAGANASAVNRYGSRPLFLACVSGNPQMIALLLKAGADPNVAGPEGETPLMTAARSGNKEAVTLILDAGAAINAKETWRGQTALMWAAGEGHAAIIRTLVAHGADVHARSERGFTPLLFAAREGHIDAVKALLEAGANLNEGLRAAGARPAADADAGAPPAAASPAAAPPAQAGLNAFLIAAANAHYELAAMLLDRGADPNAAPLGWTALHQLTWVRKAGIAGSNNPSPEGSGDMDSLTFARTLVKKGANVNAKVTRRPPAGVTRLNMIGGTPFLLAARTADAEFMRLLVELGADPLMPNADGTTPLMVAAGVGTSAPGEDPGTEPEVLEATQLALKLGNDINAVDKNGETPMHGAAAKHVPSVVRFLASAGAKMEIYNRKNKEGYTALEITQGVHRSMSIVASRPTEAAMKEVMGVSQPRSNP
jgi:ankyrin repeat protein